MRIFKKVLCTIVLLIIAFTLLVFGVLLTSIPKFNEFFVSLLFAVGDLLFIQIMIDKIWSDKKAKSEKIKLAEKENIIYSEIYDKYNNNHIVKIKDDEFEMFIDETHKFSIEYNEELSKILNICYDLMKAGYTLKETLSAIKNLYENILHKKQRK